MGNAKQAIKDSKRAIRLSPNFLMPYMVLARALSLTGERDSALKIYHYTVEKDSSYAFFAYNLIALEYWERGKLFSAYKYLRKSIRYNNNLTDTIQKTDNLFVVGLGCYQLKYFNKAISYFKKIDRLIPNDRYTLYNISCCYSMLKNKSKALYYLKRAIQAGLYDFHQIAETSDFDYIRDEPEFKELMKRYFASR